VAHDFNNLLTVIIGSLDLIQRYPGDAEKIRRRADMAIEAANRGAQLTRQLLAFSRRQSLKPEIVDPNRLIREFEGLLKQAVGEAVNIRLELARETAPVRLDPAQFQTAILNLVVNARDAMGGAGTLRIITALVSLDQRYAELNPEAAPGNYVRIAVADAGCGMDEETAAHAFEPFFTTKEVGKGSGLGLSQVYGFAKSADGHVRIQSKPGEGTVVEIYLPRTDATFPSLAPMEKAPIVQASAAGESILLVEDEPGVRDTTNECLAELGYQTIVVADATAALDLLRSGARVDLVLSDVVMPGRMNGAELAVAIRKMHPGLPILLTSGYPAGVLNRTRDMPGDIEILPKPYRHEELARRLRRLLDARA
jgi:CheY-like chemotaxis protein